MTLGVSKKLLPQLTTVLCFIVTRFILWYHNLQLLRKSDYSVPDGNNLAHIQMVVIQLGDEDGSYRLIECCAVHVNGGTDWEDEAGDPLVNAIVLLGTSEGDRQSCRAVR